MPAILLIDTTLVRTAAVRPKDRAAPLTIGYRAPLPGRSFAEAVDSGRLAGAERHDRLVKFVADHLTSWDAVGVDGVSLPVNSHSVQRLPADYLLAIEDVLHAAGGNTPAACTGDNGGN